MAKQSQALSVAKRAFAGALQGLTNGDGLLDRPSAQGALYSIASAYDIDAKTYSALAVNYIAANWAGLSGCTPETILGCFMQLCSMAIPLRTMQPLAYLIPYGGKCTIQIGAEGWVVLARRNYPNLTIRTEYVTQAELNKGFSIEKKNGRVFINHTLDPMRQDVDAVAMYAAISINNPDIITDIKLMSKAEANQLEKLARNKNVWNTWRGSMWGTKLVKRIAKTFAPSDPDGWSAATSLDADDTEVTVDATYTEVSAQTILDEYAPRIAACQTRDELASLFKEVKDTAQANGIEDSEISAPFAARNAAIVKAQKEAHG